MSGMFTSDGAACESHEGRPRLRSLLREPAVALRSPCRSSGASARCQPAVPCGLQLGGHADAIQSARVASVPCSLAAQRNDGIDPCGTAGWDVACRHDGRCEEEKDRAHREPPLPPLKGWQVSSKANPRARRRSLHGHHTGQCRTPIRFPRPPAPAGRHPRRQRQRSPDPARGAATH